MVVVVAVLVVTVVVDVVHAPHMTGQVDLANSPKLPSFRQSAFGMRPPHGSGSRCPLQVPSLYVVVVNVVVEIDVVVAVVVVTVAVVAVVAVPVVVLAVVLVVVVVVSDVRVVTVVVVAVAVVDDADVVVVAVVVVTVVVVVDEVHTPHMTGQVDLANLPNWLFASHCSFIISFPQTPSSTAP